LGTATAVTILGLSQWYALLVGAALAPTDAALGSAVMADRRIPYRVRQTLNVESGLNLAVAGGGCSMSAYLVAIIAILCLAIILDLIWSRIRARRAASAG
jgi:NhaP-type Na+/H+ and K+/H+ antiporter